MDPLIKILNKRISNQIANQNQPAQNQPQKLNFADVLDSKRSNTMIEKMSEIITQEKGSEMQVHSASNIQINRLETDVEMSQSQSDPQNKIVDLFSSLNEDMLGLDASIEVLADPNVRLSRRQLLAYQAGIGHMTINTELFSKLAQATSQNLTTILNTNVG